MGEEEMEGGRERYERCVGGNHNSNNIYLFLLLSSSIMVS